MRKITSLPLTVTFILSLILTVSFSCNIASESKASLSQDSLNVADAEMQALVDEGKLPCISTMIIKDGKVVRRLTTGLANLEENRVLEEDAIFRIYSMSKPIATAALMILYDEGKFQLDDPVAGYIPEFEETKVWVDGEEVDQQEPFTIRHLLTHTAGFCYGWDVSHVDSLYAQATPQGLWGLGTLEEAVKLLATIPLKNQPGSQYEYSVSIDVAGYLLEVLSGMPFDEFLQTRLFDPLKMVDTGFDVPEEDQGRLAMIYTKNPETGELTPVEGLTNAVKQKVTLFSGGGGLVSTLSDYGRFGQMLLNGGELDGVRVLQESTVNLIMSAQMPSDVTYEEGFRYGLGGHVNQTTGEYQWSGMASTDFIADPKNNMVLLAFTQYIPFMEVPFAAEYRTLVRKALVEETEAD
ncbi:MAG: beta-lactamase family protein [Bacteroidales bacterium]|nr:beta-lactamase family protein [Bacteroidales bacterium]